MGQASTWCARPLACQSDLTRELARGAPFSAATSNDAPRLCEQSPVPYTSSSMCGDVRGVAGRGAVCELQWATGREGSNPCFSALPNIGPYFCPAVSLACKCRLKLPPPPLPHPDARTRAAEPVLGGARARARENATGRLQPTLADQGLPHPPFLAYGRDCHTAAPHVRWLYIDLLSAAESVAWLLQSWLASLPCACRAPHGDGYMLACKGPRDGAQPKHDVSSPSAHMRAQSQSPGRHAGARGPSA